MGRAARAVSAAQDEKMHSFAVGELAACGGRLPFEITSSRVLSLATRFSRRFGGRPTEAQEIVLRLIAGGRLVRIEEGPPSKLTVYVGLPA